MVTVSSPSQTDGKIKYDLDGLSTDTKPTLTEYPDMKNGSTYMEMDTKKLYMWDAENEQWV